MTMHYYSVLKVSALVSSVASAVSFTVVAEAQDLSNNAVKIALIAAISSLLIAVVTGGTSIILLFMNRKDARASLANQQQMKESMDGHFTKLLEKSAKQGDELVDKTDKLAHAEGRREGVESTPVRLLTDKGPVALSVSDNTGEMQELRARMDKLEKEEGEPQ
jgi:hypothetical protein